MRSRLLLYLVALTLIIARNGAGNPNLQFPEVTVHVYDYSSTPSSGLQKAEAEASLLFAHAHLRLMWVHIRIQVSDDKLVDHSTPRPGGTEVVLNVLPESRAARLHRPLNELGFTTGATAIVFIERIHLASRYIDPYVVLGHVIAHELGHSLGLHHSRGLMSKNVSGDWPVQAAQHRLQFSPKEAAQMQQSVRAPAASIAWVRRPK